MLKLMLARPRTYGHADVPAASAGAAKLSGLKLLAGLMMRHLGVDERKPHASDLQRWVAASRFELPAMRLPSMLKNPATRQEKKTGIGANATCRM